MGLQENTFLDAKNYIETWFNIKSKDGGVIPFLFNEMQKDFCENKTLRNIILKGRQHGFTSLIAALYLYETITKDGINSAIVGHDMEAMQRVFDNVKVMLFSIPKNIRPVIKYDNKGQLSFPKLNSNIFITTYRTKSIISGTVHNLLCTECALWDGNVFDIMAAMLQAIPINGSVIIESTPRGIGGYFYESVGKAKERDSGYKLFVYPWFVNREYSLVKSQWRLMPKSIRPDGNNLKLDKKELSLIEQYGLTEEQIMWRRYKMFEMGDMRVDDSGIRSSRLFSREYECNFTQSGMSVFDSSYLIPLVHFLTLPRKSIYIHGADTSEGIDGGDYSVLYTIDLNTGAVVYKDRGLWKPGEFAERIHKHCMKWGGLVGVERNNTGHGVLDRLEVMYNNEFGRRKKMPYWIYNDTDGRLGWNTREANRKLMFSEGEEALRNGDIKLAFEDENGIEELTACQYSKSMKEEAPVGMHDDAVIALLICWQMRKYYFDYEKQSKEVDMRVTVF
jgi:hypothetical protein